MVARISTQPHHIITGRRIKNRSLKIVEVNGRFYEVHYTTYFLGYPILKKKTRFEQLREAELFYQKMSFERFKGRI